MSEHLPYWSVFLYEHTLSDLPRFRHDAVRVAMNTHNVVHVLLPEGVVRVHVQATVTTVGVPSHGAGGGNRTHVDSA